MRMSILLIFGLLVFVASYSRAVDKPMIVYMSFDEADPDDIEDLSQNQHDVAIQGVKSVDGKVGKALAFEGMQDFVEIPNNDNINPTEQFTVEAWVYVEEESGGWSALVGKNPYSVGYLMWLTPVLLPRGLVWVGGTRYNVDAKGPVEKERWYHLCYTAEQGEMNIYVDGELSGTKNFPKGDFGTNANALRVGGQGAAGYIGLIDEVAVYGVALTPEEVKQDMEKGPMPLAVQSSGKLTTTWAVIKAQR